MQKHFDSPKGINNLNKYNKALWKFTYMILHEEKERVKVVNKDPDNLLVQWVHGGKTITEILKEMTVSPLS
jgi:FPC/CPF motif-containing protein YcgG